MPAIVQQAYSMLTELLRKATSERVFPGNERNQRRIFQCQRKKIAAKLHNTRLEKIPFHTFRHFKATREYYKTKDILRIMRILGYRKINNNLIYTQLVDFKDDEYVSKVATSSKEACKLVEAGFEHICKVDGSYIFRRRK